MVFLLVMLIQSFHFHCVSKTPGILLLSSLVSQIIKILCRAVLKFTTSSFSALLHIKRHLPGFSVFAKFWRHTLLIECIVVSQPELARVASLENERNDSIWVISHRRSLAVTITLFFGHTQGQPQYQRLFRRQHFVDTCRSVPFHHLAGYFHQQIRSIHPHAIHVQQSSWRPYGDCLVLSSPRL